MTGQLRGPGGLHSSPVLSVDSTERDGVVVVSLAGELDMSTAPDAAAALRAATTDAKAVVVDMTELRFFASAGLNILLQLREDLRRQRRSRTRCHGHSTTPPHAPGTWAAIWVPRSSATVS